jgi:hypothetical protein
MRTPGNILERTMNLFAKTGSWTVAAVLTAASVFGQNSKCTPSQKSFDQGHDMMQSQMMAGYNASSRTEVRGSWDVYALGAFTYWQPMQDNMELGIVSDQTGLSTSAVDGNFVNSHFGYKPGFQVALGMNFDHDQWDSMVQYTWFRGESSTTTTLNGTENPNTVLFPARVASVLAAGPSSNQSYFSGTESWKLHMDILDWQLARSFYVGTKLSFRPFFAARGAWIRQGLTAAYTNPSAGTSLARIDVSDKAQSWAVGPRTGISTDWALGEGFRLFGNGGGDILFTQYTTLGNSEERGTTPRKVYQRKLNTIRTHLDLEMGIAWGSYFDNNNWHVDLVAGYGFQVFFNQNMFRQFFGSSIASVGQSTSPNGNLYMHGLTTSARFDF